LAGVGWGHDVGIEANSKSPVGQLIEIAVMMAITQFEAQHQQSTAAHHPVNNRSAGARAQLAVPGHSQDQACPALKVAAGELILMVDHADVPRGRIGWRDDLGEQVASTRGGGRTMNPVSSRPADG